MRPLPALLCLLLCLPICVQARTVYRCVRDGTVSLSTAPEPGSKCEPKQIDDNAVQTPNLWGEMGVFSGTLYERDQDGKPVYGTRNLPGSRVYLRFTVETPPGEPAHEGLGKVDTPKLDRHARLFKATAKKTGVDDAWLRAIAHVESGFDEKALSPKGAQGVMQLMPATALEYGVKDAFSPADSIDGGAPLFQDAAEAFQERSRPRHRRLQRRHGRGRPLWGRTAVPGNAGVSGEGPTAVSRLQGRTVAAPAAPGRRGAHDR